MLCEEWLREFWVFDLDLRTLKEKVKMQTNIWSVYHKEPGWEVWLTVCCLPGKAEHPERQIWGLNKGDGCGSKVMISLLLQVFQQNVKQVQWDDHVGFTNSN